MIITTKNGDMVDTIQIIEDNVYKIEDVKYTVETDMYISATVQIRICDTGKKQLEVSDPEVGKEAQYHLRQFIKYMKQLGRYY
jgi:hypothetical protein|nr:MAG TPA: hypothetical protein [Caudoviricetes sp.]